VLRAKEIEMSNRYLVKLEEPGGDPEETFRFTFESHDDLAQILQRIEEKGVFTGEEARAFCLGLKLFSGVMLAHRADPLFAELAPEFGKFMRKLKGA
jgi:hypothetical protein